MTTDEYQLYLIDNYTISPSTTLFLEGILLFIFFTVYFTAANFFDVPDFFLLLILAEYFCFTYFYNKVFYLKYFWIIYSILFYLAGVYVIENDSTLYLYELGKYASRAHSLAPIVLVHILFLYFLNVFDLFLTPQSSDLFSYLTSRENKIITYGVLLSGIFLTIAIFAKIYNKPFFSLGIERFEYKDEVLGGLKIMTKLVLLIPAAAFYIHEKNKFLKYLPAIFIIMSVLCLFWSGSKFTEYFIIIYVYMLARTSNQLIRGRLNIIAIFKKSSAILLSLLMVVFVYKILLDNTTANLFRIYLYQRLSQQGQIWWSVYSDTTTTHYDEISDEVKAIFNSDINENNNTHYGIYKMMWMASNKSLFVKQHIANGAAFTASTQASLYYYGGFTLLILITLAFAFFYSLVINKSIIAFANKRIFDSIIYVILIIKMHLLLFMSSFNTFISLNTLLMIIFLLFTNLTRAYKKYYMQLYL